MSVAPAGRPETAPEETGGDSGMCVVYYTPAGGRLRLVTLFLPRQWQGAEVSFHEQGAVLQIAQGQNSVTLPLHFGE